MTVAPWEADPAARLVRRLGPSPRELGTTNLDRKCPDIWELDNGDIAVVGRDMTELYASALPADLIVGANERLVVIPRITFMAARTDGTDV